ncbi:MAG TPA: GtrA family protein [Pseudomonadales bacterium]|jgi:putative flippase GtrA
MRFAVVGGCGFVVDAAVLAVAVHGYGMGPIAARIISFSVAVMVTWLLNRTFTFNEETMHGPTRELVLYVLVSVTGFASNFTVYAALIYAFEWAAQYPVVALVPSSLLAAFVNYLGSARIAFRPAKK